MNATLKPFGLATGLHNHTEEFRAIGDTTGWDVFFRNTDAAVVHQLDTLHTLRAKKNPVELIKRHAGRSKSVHLRDYADLKGQFNDQPDFGRGNCPWLEVFKACETVGGTEWFIIERFGAAPPKDLEWAAQAIGFLRSHGRGRPV